jgi:uncharacterized protein (TIGR02246 family)
MTTTTRPVLGLDHDRAAVDDFVAGLQQAIDASDAARFNERFAADVLWGSPFGAVVEGYDDLHAIHSAMFGSVADGGDGTGSRYVVEHVRFPTDDVAIAFVRRDRVAATDAIEPGRADGFDELALFVLVQRDGGWWLAAGQHVPDRRREMYG